MISYYVIKYIVIWQMLYYIHICVILNIYWYSTLKPETNSDSPSIKSKGIRFNQLIF